jgi:hypothetical protein
MPIRRPPTVMVRNTTDSLASYLGFLSALALLEAIAMIDPNNKDRLQRKSEFAITSECSLQELNRIRMINYRSKT